MTKNIQSSIIKTEQGMRVIGDVVFSNVSELLEQGNQFIQAQIKSNDNDVLTIDCQAMSRIDSAGIALLLEWQRRCVTANSKCVFAKLSEQAQSLIQAYRLQAVIAAKVAA